MCLLHDRASSRRGRSTSDWNGTLVYRLLNALSFAAGQLAVFQGGPSRTGGKAPISGATRAERATRKNSQRAAAQRVALKMGRRLRCSSVTYRFRYAPSTASPARTALPAAHFERNPRDLGDGTLGSLDADRYQGVTRAFTGLELIKMTTPVSWDGPARSSFF